MDTRYTASYTIKLPIFYDEEEQSKNTAYNRLLLAALMIPSKNYEDSGDINPIYLQNRSPDQN